MAAISYREQYARYTRYFSRLAQIYGQRPAVRASFELLLTLLTISFFTVFALRPTFNAITELWSEIESQKQTKAQLGEKLTNLGNAQSALAQEQERLELLSQAMPENPQPERYLRQAEGLAARNQVSLITFNVDRVTLFGKTEMKKPKEGQENLAEARVTLSVSGEYNSLISFLQEIENLRRLIIIETVSFGAGKGKQAGSLVLTISGKIPYFTQ